MNGRPTLRTHTLAQIAAWYRRLPCPTCFAPAGAACLDRRSRSGRRLYGVNVHPRREEWCLQAAYYSR